MAASSYTLYDPQEVRAPFVFAVPHSGRDYPKAMRLQSSLSELELRSSEDAYVDELFSFAPSLGAPLLVANYARAYVDLNRAPDEIDSALFDWSASTPKTDFRRTHRVRAGLGVIPRFVANSKAIYTGLVPPSEIENRLETVYHPYHQQLVSLLTRAKQEFGYAVLIDCHSMPTPDPVLGFKRPGPDIVIGDSWGSSADRSLTAQVESLFRRYGYSARRNLPYAGGFATTHYGKPQKRVHALQLELSRGLYVHEQRLQKKPKFDQLSSDLHGIMATLLEGAGSSRMAAE